MSNFNNKQKCFRLVIPDAVNSFTVPDDVTWVLMKNVGANALIFNYDDDDASDYYTIDANSEMPCAIRVRGGTTFNTDGVGGPTTLEVVAWG